MSGRDLWSGLLALVPKAYQPLAVLLALLVALATLVRRNDLNELHAQIQAKADTSAVSAMHTLLLEVRAAVDSQSLRQSEYFCDSKPKWCR